MAIDLKSYIYLDRFCNEGTRTYSDQAAYTEARECFRHNVDHPGFDLPCFSLPRESMNLYMANPDPEILARYVTDEHVVFPIHPQTLTEAGSDPYVLLTLASGEKVSPVRVLPSSSTRTLYVDGGIPAHALKVHFPFRISRYDRRMRDEVVEQAVAVSLELEQGLHNFGSDFAFMREVLGITHRNRHPESPRGEHWGFLIRELNPFPDIADPGNLIPGFALYGHNLFKPEEPPLLLELIRDKEPLGFILEQLMLPVVRQWVTCYRQFGFFLEPHGQNLMLETGMSGRIRRLVHRDLSVGIDMRRRSYLGLSSGHLNTYNRMESGIFGSIAYDKFMGHHFFDALVGCACKYYPALSLQDFTHPCKALFKEMFPEHNEFLPATQHYFTGKRDQFGKPMYEDLGTRPLWRP